MTILEEQFMRAAINFFSCSRKEKSQFIEVRWRDPWYGKPSNFRVTINKNAILRIEPCQHNEDEPSAARIYLIPQNGERLMFNGSYIDYIYTVESYDEIKNML